MSEIEITLPTVQYGNVKLTCQPEELDDLIKSADTLGVATAVYLNIFTQGFKAGSQMDVSAPQGASQHDDMVKAHELLDEGLGGVTEVRSVEQIMSDEGVDTIDQARKIQEREVSAPWEKDAVAPQPKPWETDVTAPVVLDASW